MSSHAAWFAEESCILRKLENSESEGKTGRFGLLTKNESMSFMMGSKKEERA
jgi:hypothetical protein